MANDTDLDDVAVTWSAWSAGRDRSGTLTLNADGTFCYTHDGSENFSDSFTYRVSDDDGRPRCRRHDHDHPGQRQPAGGRRPTAITVAEGGTATTA